MLQRLLVSTVTGRLCLTGHISALMKTVPSTTRSGVFQHTFWLQNVIDGPIDYSMVELFVLTSANG